jgi:hypothetical protein
MISLRCKLVVKAALEELGLNYTQISLGEADIAGEITEP